MPNYPSKFLKRELPDNLNWEEASLKLAKALPNTILQLTPKGTPHSSKVKDLFIKSGSGEVFWIEKESYKSGHNGRVSIVRNKNGEKFCLKKGKIDQAELDYLKRKNWLIDSHFEPQTGKQKHSFEGIIVMPYLGADNLRERIDKQKISETETFNIILQTAAIVYKDFHSIKLAHGDISPKNIMINKRNQVALIDPCPLGELKSWRFKQTDENAFLDMLGTHCPNKFNQETAESLAKQGELVQKLAELNLSQQFRKDFLSFKDNPNLQNKENLKNSAYAIFVYLDEHYRDDPAKFNESMHELLKSALQEINTNAEFQKVIENCTSEWFEDGCVSYEVLDLANYLLNPARARLREVAKEYLILQSGVGRKVSEIKNSKNAGSSSLSHPDATNTKQNKKILGQDIVAEIFKNSQSKQEKSFPTSCSTVEEKIKYVENHINSMDSLDCERILQKFSLHNINIQTSKKNLLTGDYASKSIKIENKFVKLKLACLMKRPNTEINTIAKELFQAAGSIRNKFKSFFSSYSTNTHSSSELIRLLKDPRNKCILGALQIKPGNDKQIEKTVKECMKRAFKNEDILTTPIDNNKPSTKKASSG